MTTSKDLLLAILAMDSYNQGYDPGLVTGVTHIGEATLKDNPASLDTSNWQSSGFYAAAYTWGNDTVFPIVAQTISASIPLVPAIFSTAGLRLLAFKRARYYGDSAMNLPTPSLHRRA